MEKIYVVTRNQKWHIIIDISKKEEIGNHCNQGIACCLQTQKMPLMFIRFTLCQRDFKNKLDSHTLISSIMVCLELV